MSIKINNPPNDSREPNQEAKMRKRLTARETRQGLWRRPEGGGVTSARTKVGAGHLGYSSQVIILGLACVK